MIMMHKLLNCLILVLIGVTSSCQVKSSYTELARQVDSGINEEASVIREQLLVNGRELSDFLPDGHSKHADIEYTKELQKGIDLGGVILLPDYPLLVNEEGLSIRSNTELVFRENSKLIMKPNSETHYAVLDITNAKNVNVYFANIEGDRFRHLTNKGEWGMGIRIQGSQNVNLHAPVISDCWGDGIYIRSLAGAQSKGITIKNFKINRARRNGISIISADGLLIENGLISGTVGTAPQSAIDIEPNRPSDTLKNIVIRDLITHDNKGDGIMILLANLTLKGEEKGSQNVSIEIDNHTDIGSSYPVRINGRSRNGNDKYDRSLKIGGEIVFRNPKWTWNKEESPVRFSPGKDRVMETGFNPQVKFENITIIGVNGEVGKKQDEIRRRILEDIQRL